MSSGIETVDIVEPWIYGRLHGDTQVRAAVADRIVAELAAGDVPVPYITFSVVSQRDRLTVDGRRLWVDALYDIKVVGQGASWGGIAPLARRIDMLFGDGQTVLADTPKGRIECTRERGIQYAELIQAVQFRHLGSQFRLRAYSS